MPARARRSIARNRTSVVVRPAMVAAKQSIAVHARRRSLAAAAVCRVNAAPWKRALARLKLARISI
jgi:hypothetical protein